MSLNGNLGLSWGITQPTEKNFTSDVTWKKIKTKYYCYVIFTHAENFSYQKVVKNTAVHYQKMYLKTKYIFLM